MEPYVGEIRAVAFNFAPKGWAVCAGQLLPISQNTALFSLLGTTYGGDGKSTFALPDLRGRAAMNFGQGPGLSLRDLGETGGEASVTLITSEMPSHSHTLNAVAAQGSQDSPAGGLLAEASVGPISLPGYAAAGAATATLAGSAVAPVGGQPHENRPPYLVMNYVIALQGVFPPRS